MILTYGDRLFSFNGRILDYTSFMSDILSPLVNAEVPISGATTLDNTAFGKMHVCSGSTADYLVGLPSVSGNAGKLIGFRMAASLSKLVTLDGNSSEAIDGELTRIMWANEAAIIYCDGVSWTKIAGRAMPIGCRITKTSGQTVQNSSVEKVLFDNVVYQSTAGLFDAVNSRIIVPRKGQYILTGCVFYLGVGGAGVCQIFISKSTTGNPIEVLGQTYAAAGSNPAPLATQPAMLNTSDPIYLHTRHFTGSTATIYTAEPVNYLILQEIPSW